MHLEIHTKTSTYYAIIIWYKVYFGANIAILFKIKVKKL